MRATKIAGFTFLLSLVLVYSPTHLSGQFRSRGGDSGGFGKGGFGKGGFSRGDFGKGGFGKGDFGKGGFGKGDFGKGGFSRGDFGKGGFSRGDFGKGGFSRGDFGKGGFGRSSMTTTSSDGPKVIMTTPGMPPGGMPPGGFGPPPGGDSDNPGLRRVREQDKNGDGRVSRDEADSNLSRSFDRLDTNRDGYVDTAEYTGYYASRSSGGDSRDRDSRDSRDRDSRDRDSRDPRRGSEPEEEPKPIAVRYGHLPKGLPEWYESDDLDKDGQVALYEWRNAGKSIEEFLVMDRNSDGLVTSDEVLRNGAEQVQQDKIAALLNEEEGGPTRGFAANGESSTKKPSGDDNRSGNDRRRGWGRPSSNGSSSDKGSANKPNPFRRGN